MDSWLRPPEGVLFNDGGPPALGGGLPPRGLPPLNFESIETGGFAIIFSISATLHPLISLHVAGQSSAMKYTPVIGCSVEQLVMATSLQVLIPNCAM